LHGEADDFHAANDWHRSVAEHLSNLLKLAHIEGMN
jgi:hypothetical protein